MPQVLGHILGVERLHRTVEFNRETAELSELSRAILNPQLSTEGRQSGNGPASGPATMALQQSESIVTNDQSQTANSQSPALPLLQSSAMSSEVPTRPSGEGKGMTAEALKIPTAGPEPPSADGQRLSNAKPPSELSSLNTPRASMLASHMQKSNTEGSLLQPQESTILEVRQATVSDHPGHSMCYRSVEAIEVCYPSGLG